MAQKEKLEEAKRLYQTANADQRYVLESLFPELKESEDERIRKELIFYLRYQHSISENFKDIGKWIAWLEKQGSQNNTEDEDLLYRFCFYSYKDESNILYLSGLYVNGECRNKGIGTKILEVADEVAKNLNCYAIRLKTKIGSNAERLYRRNGYNTFKREGNNVWLQKQGEHKKFRDSIQVGDEVTRNSDGVIVNLSQLKRVAKKSEQKLPIEKLPSEMKTIRESLGFTTQKECDEYNQMVSDLIMSDSKVEQKPTCLLDNSKSNVEFPFKAKVKRNGKIVTIYGGQLSMNGKEWIKYQSNKEDGYMVYEPEDLELVYNIEQKPVNKIEPKFKAGDKVIGIVSDMQYYITDVCYDHYYTESGCIIMFCSQDNFKLVEQKPAWNEEELTDFEKSLKHVMEETLECGDIHNLKADADLLLRLVKPTDDDMKEALRTEYEKGRADAFAQMQKEWSEEDEKMVANLVDYFKVDDALQYTEKQVVDWLKSLKNKVQPQNT